MNEFYNAIGESRNVSSMIDNKSIEAHHRIKHDEFITNDEDNIANDEITIDDNITSERQAMIIENMDHGNNNHNIGFESNAFDNEITIDDNIIIKEPAMIIENIENGNNNK